MHESNRAEPQQFQVMNFRKKIVRVEGVGGGFTRSRNDRFKGDREMAVCEMDSVVVAARQQMRSSERRAASIELNSLRGLVGLAPLSPDSTTPNIEPRWYCRTLHSVETWLLPRAAEAQEGEPPSAAAFVARPGAPGRVGYAPHVATPRVSSANVHRDRVKSARIRAANYLVEIHKKYAIAAASFVFVLVGVPVAISFPRAGVGLVIGVSLAVFSVYYVGLIGGESLGNQLVVPPALAMWSPNIVFGTLGLLALWHVRNQATRGRHSRWVGYVLARVRRHPRP
jgi:hypothetical protein